MAVNTRGPSKGELSELPLNTELNTGINPKAPKRSRSATEIEALLDVIRGTPGWYGHAAGDLAHRYVFCWRWAVPETPVLFCYSEAHWRKLRERWERALGLIE